MPLHQWKSFGKFVSDRKCVVRTSRLQVMHGGLFSKDDVTLKDIRAVDRVKQPPEEGLMSELLWSDPQPQNGRSESKRGVGTSSNLSIGIGSLRTFVLGLQFGPDVTERFLKHNNLEYVVRSHEVKQDGYELAHNGSTVRSIARSKFFFFVLFQVNVSPCFQRRTTVIRWVTKGHLSR